MKYCQGNKCHEYRTKDRIRGTKGNKSYQTRRRSSFYYGGGNFCSLNCQNDWLNKNIEHALNHFGRTTSPNKVECDNAWYKDYTYGYPNDRDYRLVNDLLGKRILLTKQQYDNTTTENINQLVNQIQK